MNTKFQAEKDAVKSFATEQLQSCRACWWTIFAAALHKPRVAAPSGRVSSHHLSYIASALHTHDWMLRNPAIAGDTFQLSALFKPEPELTTRTAYKEEFRTEVWPPLAAEVDQSSTFQELTHAFCNSKVVQTKSKVGRNYCLKQCKQDMAADKGCDASPFVKESVWWQLKYCFQRKV